MEARYDTALPQSADAPKSMSSRAAEMTRERGGAVLYRASLRGALALLWRMMRGAKFSFDHLWREFFAVDLFAQVRGVETPGYFLLGRDDHVVTAEVALRYFDALEAPRGKRLIWFEHSAHWPQLEEPEKFRRVMVEQVLAENR